MKAQTTESMGRFSRFLFTTAVAITLLLGANLHAEIALKERVITTPRHIITVDETGLPAQLEIPALSGEIPLLWRTQEEARAKKAESGRKAGNKAKGAQKEEQPARPSTLLQRMGRGPQWVSPVRIEASIDGARMVGKADAPAALQKTDQGVEATSTWQAGHVKGGLRLLYTEDGAMTGQVTFTLGDGKLERLDLVLELSGPVDTAIAGNPADAVAGNPLSLQYGSLASEPGVLWSNGATPAGDGGAHKGQVGHFFLGSGDRGFTWMAHGDKGFAIGGDEPSMSVERTREDVTVWRIALVNMPADGGERGAGFTLLTHPSRFRAADRRVQQWRVWPGEVALPKLEAAARGSLGDNGLVRADAASVHEAGASRALLLGPAGGDALSVEDTLADRFPIGLFRYLSASHTALAAQVRPNAAALVSPGDSPAPDRMALGRALLHDIGVDLRGIAGGVEAAALVRILENFGYFSADGKTEFLPYWRAEGIVRYGEAFGAEAKSGFAVTTENPAGRTRVSTFVRPAGGALKALFVIVNEADVPVRELLYIQQPRYCFGLQNKLKIQPIYAQLDFSHIPTDSDWGRRWVGSSGQPVTRAVKTGSRGYVKGGGVADLLMRQLMDAESGGYVRLVETGTVKTMTTKKSEEFEIYGPVFVPARGMRVLFGSGAENSLPQGIEIRVAKDAGDGSRTPLVVPVHIFQGVFNESETPAADEKRPLVATVETAADGTFRYPLERSGVYTIAVEWDGKMHPSSPEWVQAGHGAVFWPWVEVEAGRWVTVSVLCGPGAIMPSTGVAGRVVDRQTGKPLACNAHLFRGVFQASETAEVDAERRPLCQAKSLDKDGRFRLMCRTPSEPGGFGWCTVALEIDGKMYPTSTKWDVDGETKLWPRIRVEAGKWTEVSAEVEVGKEP